MPERNELLTLDEAAQRYGLSREGIYYHRRKGNLKIYKRAGDKKSYVSIAEMDKLTSFKAVEETGSASSDEPSQELSAVA